MSPRGSVPRDCRRWRKLGRTGPRGSGTVRSVTERRPGSVAGCGRWGQVLTPIDKLIKLHTYTAE